MGQQRWGWALQKQWVSKIQPRALERCLPCSAPARGKGGWRLPRTAADLYPPGKAKEQSAGSRAPRDACMGGVAWAFPRSEAACSNPRTVKMGNEAGTPAGKFQKEAGNHDNTNVDPERQLPSGTRSSSRSCGAQWRMKTRASCSERSKRRAAGGREIQSLSPSPVASLPTGCDFFF